LERWVAARLSPRERLAAEFLTAGDPAWAPNWPWLAVATAVAAVTIFLFGGYGVPVVLFAGYLVLASAAPVLGGYWAGLRHAHTGTMQAPLYALYPLGFGEMARVILKVNLTRCLIATPLLVGVGALAGWKLQLGAASGMAFALKAVGFLVAVQPALVTFRFSSDTADTRQLRWYWVGLLVVGALALVGLGAWVFTASGWASVLGGLTATLVSATGLLLLYASLWGKARFDLLAPIAPD